MKIKNWKNITILKKFSATHLGVIIDYTIIRVRRQSHFHLLYKVSQVVYEHNILALPLPKMRAEGSLEFTDRIKIPTILYAFSSPEFVTKAHDKLD